MPTKKMAKQKHVVFDLVGILISLDTFHTRVTNVIGLKLIAQYITPKLFAHSWMTDAELEYTRLSVSGRYTTYLDVLRATFFRSLHLAGIQNPRHMFTEQEREACVQGYSELGLRQGATEATTAFREAGFKVWCFTSGDNVRVQNYFQQAGISAPTIISCDSIGIAKPAPKAYAAILKHIPEGDEMWYVAAHQWSVSAAVKCGFKGALCTDFEGEALWDISEHDMTVVGQSLKDTAKKVIAF